MLVVWRTLADLPGVVNAGQARAAADLVECGNGLNDALISGFAGPEDEIGTFDKRYTKRAPNAHLVADLLARKP